MPVRVLGPFGGSLSMIVEGMNYAGLNGARAANMSLNASGQFTVIPETLAANQQTLFVVSAGNNGTDNDAAPKAPCYDPTVPLPPIRTTRLSATATRPCRA